MSRISPHAIAVTRFSYVALANNPGGTALTSRNLVEPEPQRSGNDPNRSV